MVQVLELPHDFHRLNLDIGVPAWEHDTTIPLRAYTGLESVEIEWRT